MRANREHPPDYLIRRVEELVGDAPFHDLDRHITRAELRWFSEGYKRITGFALEDMRVGPGGAWRRPNRRGVAAQ